MHKGICKLWYHNWRSVIKSIYINQLKKLVFLFLRLTIELLSAEEGNKLEALLASTSWIWDWILICQGINRYFLYHSNSGHILGESLMPYGPVSRYGKIWVLQWASKWISQVESSKTWVKDRIIQNVLSEVEADSLHHLGVTLFVIFLSIFLSVRAATTLSDRNLIIVLVWWMCKPFLSINLERKIR